MKEYKIIDSVESLEEGFERVKAAQKKFATYTQKKI